MAGYRAWQVATRPAETGSEPPFVWIGDGRDGGPRSRSATTSSRRSGRAHVTVGIADVSDICQLRSTARLDLPVTDDIVLDSQPERSDTTLACARSDSESLSG